MFAQLKLVIFKALFREYTQNQKKKKKTTSGRQRRYLLALEALTKNSTTELIKLIITTSYSSKIGFISDRNVVKLAQVE